jgi:hypothetical protein
MYEPNGLPQWLLPTNRLACLKERIGIAWTQLKTLPPPVKLACGLTLLVLLAFCSGCATKSPPAEWPKNPPPPQISEPLPQNSYSSKVQKLLEGWLQRVIGTPQT